MKNKAEWFEYKHNEVRNIPLKNSISKIISQKDDDEEVYEVECPNCNDIIYLDESMLEEEEMICPGCGTRLEFEFECDCDGTPDCDCGCQEDK